MRPVNSLEALLDQLTTGDDVAAEQVYLTYEPYLRSVVRRMLPDELRPKFDSLDVVQSVWGDVLSRFRGGGMRFTSVAQLRSFLIKATHHRFIDRVRTHRTAVRQERPLSMLPLEPQPKSRSPRASEVAQAAELWERLLAACPVEHHQLLILRREGCSLSEIAQRSGLHEGSVRRILRTVAVKCAGDGQPTSQDSQEVNLA